jgi:hypothetical protein
VCLNKKANEEKFTAHQILSKCVRTLSQPFKIVVASEEPAKIGTSRDRRANQPDHMKFSEI